MKLRKVRRKVKRKIKRMYPTTIGDQMYIGTKYRQARFDKDISQDKYDKVFPHASRELREMFDAFSNKPGGGLWTSSARGLPGKRWSEWSEWTHRNKFYTKSPEVRCTYATIVSPSPNAAVYEIESKDIPLDYKKLRNRADAIHFSRDLVKHARKKSDYFHGWDVESTFWFKPSFKVVGKVPICKDEKDQKYFRLHKARFRKSKKRRQR